MLLFAWALIIFILVVVLILYSAATLDIDEYTNKFIGRERRRQRAES
jgi:hypothetical protein